MRTLTLRVLLAATVLAVSVVITSSSAVAATQQPRWRVFFTSPAGPSELTSIVSTGPKNAWAVGTNRAGLYVVHWNGTRWQRENVPGTRNFSPDGIQATSSNNVWITGTGPNLPLTAMVWNGSGWHKTTLPADTSDIAVLSRTDVWGIDASGTSCTAGSDPVCTSVIWHWSQGTVTSFGVAGLAQNIASAGDHVWVLSKRAIQGDTSLPTVYYGDDAGLHQIPSPTGRMGVFPQITASPRGQLWLLAPGPTRHRFGHIDYWNGQSWTRTVIPARSGGKFLSYGSWGFIYDNRNGVWLGPYTHWTGRRWIVTTPAMPTQAFELMYIAPIPRSASAWAVGFNNARPGSQADRGLIALSGRRP